MCRHLPASNSREILLLFGSLTTCDPGNIHETIDALARDGVRCSVVSLAAELKVLKDLARRTRGRFGVALNEGHLRDLIFEAVPPPELEASSQYDKERRAARKRDRLQRRMQRGGDVTAPEGGGSGDEEEDSEEDEDDDDEMHDGTDLLCMGFPTRLPPTSLSKASLCACHSRLRTYGFTCARCAAKLCDVPTDCPVCGLTAVMSTHLARSYHHLFPVPGYRALGWHE